MARVLRNMGAIVVGMIVAIVLVIAIEFASAAAYPVPPNFGGTMEEMCLYVANIPQWLLALAVLAWGATAFVSTWTAQRIGSRGSALITGLLLLAAVIFNIVQLPYPIWFKLANLVVVPTAIVYGCRLSIRPKTIASNQLS